MAPQIKTTLNAKTKKPESINITMTVGESLNIPEIGIKGADSKNLQFTELTGNGIRVSKEGVLTAESAGNTSFVIRLKNSKNTIQAWVTIEEPENEIVPDVVEPKSDKTVIAKPHEYATEIVVDLNPQEPKPVAARPVEARPINQKPITEGPIYFDSPYKEPIQEQPVFSRSSSLRIAITEAMKQDLLNICDIDNSSSFIEKYLNLTGRQLIVRLTNDEKTALRLFRESVLSELPEMTVIFGYYAAYAGIRNAWDLSRVSYSKLSAVIKILGKTIKYPFENDDNTQTQSIEISDSTIQKILKECGSLIPAINPHYYLVAPGDPEPSYLFANKSARTDGEIIREGLEFLQNIELTLPLPRTITGTVKMKKLGEDDKDAVSKPGYLVQISGISSPAQDKVEDEEDLIGWSDSDGKFYIAMPDRYNLQETIKIVISENKNATDTVVTARTVSDTVPKMTFIRRASEVMQNDGINVPGEGGDYTFIPAHRLMQDITDLDRLNKENLAFEQRFHELILSYGKVKDKKHEIDKKLYDLYCRYDSIKEALEHYHGVLEKEYSIHQKAYENAVEDNILLDSILEDQKKTENDLKIVKSYMRKISKAADGFKNLEQSDNKKDALGVDLNFSDIIEKINLQDELAAAHEIYQELLALELEKLILEDEAKDADEDSSLKEYLKEHKDDEDVKRYLDNQERIKTLLQTFYLADATTDNLEATLKHLLSTSFISDLGDFILVQDLFDSSSTKPRALPSVRLMGEGKDAIFLPTDTAPSRIFNYSMVQRLVEPNFSNNIAEGLNLKRSKLLGMVDAADFKRKLYEEPDNVPVATSLGIGYILNMHQAWIPDGFALGNLLYSLILAPGEEQRIIVEEHTQSYVVRDEASALDTIRDTYANTQQDNEAAAFSNAADRYSSAHSDYNYYSQASSSGDASLKFIKFGLSGNMSSTSTNTGSGASNAMQSDNYSEVSRAAQEFQTEIKTESSRIAAAQRTSIRTASSSETDSVASRIIANHNHSHVMTVQYWEVARRYRMETCIEGVELILFVPMKPVRFLPSAGNNSDYLNFDRYNLITNDNNTDDDKKDNLLIPKFDKKTFSFRYQQLLRYADTLTPALPYKYRNGLNLIKKYAAYPEWKMEKKTGGSNQKITFKLTGNFMEFDEIETVLYFSHSSTTVQGIITDKNYLWIHPSLNTRESALYGMGKLRNRAVTTKKEAGKMGFTILEKPETPSWTIEFTIPSNLSKDDISHIRIIHRVYDWKFKLSQERQYMTEDERLAISGYEHKKVNLFEDDESSGYDYQKIAHYSEGLPECYTNPYVTYTKSELLALGPLAIEVKKMGDNGDETNSEDKGSVSLHQGSAVIDLSDHIPVLRYNEVMKIEETFHHILSDTMHYSQVIWSDLSDDERIMLLEPYTVDMDYNLYSSFEKTGRAPVSVPLLNCVNAKRVLGFYGNCMVLPFTYPKELADILGKTAADIQEELYRYHTTNFRVPSTVISVPTQGMVGEAVLGATNVSEKIDITRFWNWKDSDIDHINLTQNTLNSNSLLSSATTRDIDAPTQGVAATAHIDNSSLLQALTNRAAPNFANVLGNTDIRDLLKSVDQNASSGRDKVVDSTSGMITKALDAAAQVASAYFGGKGAKGDDNQSGGDGNKPGEGEKPSGEGEKPSGEGGKPSGEGGKPAGEDDDHTEEPGKPPPEGGENPSGAPKPSPEVPKPSQETPKPSQETPKPSQETPKPSQETPKPTEEQPKKDPYGILGLLPEALQLYKEKVSGIDYFNKHMTEMTGEDRNYQKCELEAFLRDYCEENGEDYDDIVTAIKQSLGQKGE